MRAVILSPTVDSLSIAYCRRMMFCPDCDTNLDEVEVGNPCPGCSGMRREAIVSPKSVPMRVDVPEVGVKVTRGDLRPWTEKWQIVRHYRDALAATYSGASGRVGNLEVEGRVQSFFVECDHLQEWLENDVENFAGASKADIQSHVQGSNPLTVCKAISNTRKHHTREWGSTARIRETSTESTGASVALKSIGRHQKPQPLTLSTSRMSASRVGVTSSPASKSLSPDHISESGCAHLKEASLSHFLDMRSRSPLLPETRGDVEAVIDPLRKENER